MDIKLSVVLAIIVAGIFPALSIYVWQVKPMEYSEEGAIDLALHFLRNSPTYRFDGIPDSIRVVGVEALRRPYTWEVTIAFQCLHAGYGDRTGKMLAQVITPHEILVVVEEDRVVRAIVDDKWDELEQKEHVQGELLPPESARDAAIEYMLRTHEGLGGLRAPSPWESRDLTPELVGASNLQYIGDGWAVNVSYPVVLRPIYTVEIEYTGEVSIHWKGTVDQEGAVDELEYTVAR